MTPADCARISVSINVPPSLAFELFTTDLDRWWQRGPRFRHGRGASKMYLEARLDGRVFESFGNDSGGFEIGRVRVWDPPHRLVFSWRNSNFSPAESTEVEVVFAPARSGTLLVVTHRGLASLPPDHPARHGLPASEFVRMLGLWWGEQLSALRRFASLPT